MNKTIANKTVQIMTRVAKDMGIEDVMITTNESPMNDKRLAIYIDGDLYDAYWGQGYFGWEYQNRVTAELEKAGIWIEAYNNSILDVYELSKV